MFGRITFKSQVELVHLTIHFVDSSSIDADNAERYEACILRTVGSVLPA